MNIGLVDVVDSLPDDGKSLETLAALEHVAQLLGHLADLLNPQDLPRAIGNLTGRRASLR